MRKDAKTTKTAEITQVQRYHQGGSHSDAEAYAFAGFRSNKYFTSDRYIKLTDRFERVDGKPLKGFGLEIEMECRGITNQTVLAECLNKIIFTHFPDDLFKLQNDCSLSGDTSAEAITQIMTKEFIRNNYANFKLMYNTYFPAFKLLCGDSCGMHVNISNGVLGKTAATQAEAIRKLYYIVNHHYDFCCALFARNPSRTHYCGRMTAEKEYCKTFDLAAAWSDHGVSFNLGHFTAGRIEIRLVGGQKNFGAFRNTMESVFHLCDAVKSLSWDDVDDLEKIFSGCNQYVYDRLNTLCRTSGTISDAQLDTIAQTVKREDLI